jgi:hypothetical protein
MFPRMRLTTFAAGLLVSFSLWSAEPTPAELAELKAAIIVLTFDRLDASCNSGGSYADTQRKQVNDWQQNNSVEQRRSRLPHLQRDANIAQQLEKSVNFIVQAVRAKGANDCMAATTLTQLADAQIGKLAVPVGAPAAASAAPKPTAAPVATPALLASIDSFGFATRAKMGIGGFIALDIYPIVLFKSGEVLKRVADLKYPGGLAAHRAAHSDQWTRWQRNGNQLQLLKDGQWENITFKTYARLPADLRLSGKFRSIGGTGNIAVGGSQSVTVVDEYLFANDGTVLRSGAASSRAETGDTTVVTTSGPRERRGRYYMDGLLLRIDYEDGSREQRILIADPKDPDGTIWLDGESYVKRSG